MFGKPKHTFASQDHPNAAAGTQGAAADTSSRRQFFARLSQVGAGLVGGLALTQATSARSETATSAGVTAEPSAGTTASSPIKPVGFAGVVTTYVYSREGRLEKYTDDSGKWHAGPDMASTTPATGSSGDMQAAAPTRCNARRGADLNTDWIYDTDSE